MNIHEYVMAVARQCEEYFGFLQDEIKIVRDSTLPSVGCFYFFEMQIAYSNKLIYEDVPHVIAHEFVHAKQFKNNRFNIPDIGLGFITTKITFENKEYSVKRDITYKEYANLPWEYEANRDAIDFCRHYGYDTNTKKIRMIKEYLNLM